MNKTIEEKLNEGRSYRNIDVSSLEHNKNENEKKKSFK